MKKRYYLVSEEFLEEVKKRKSEQTAFGLIDRITKESSLIELSKSLTKQLGVNEK